MRSPTPLCVTLILLTVCAAPSALQAQEGPRVLTGADRIAAGHVPDLLRNRRVGLITNHTGRTHDGRRLIDVLHAHPEIDLKLLFSPEHGIAGKFDEKVGDATDEFTGLRIRSLYGATRKPRPEDLTDLDVLVFDIQDIGTRFYTYISTMVSSMEVAAAHGKGFLVLDRPNPIGGLSVEGPIADADQLDFVGYLRIPVRHGMTVGEIAVYAQSILGLQIDLEVLCLKGWNRSMDFEATGLQWINPSPNMRSLDAAYLYPGVGLLETTNLSVGRGTETPFEHFGAPWIDGERLADHLNGQGIAGIKFHPTQFTPDSSKFKDEVCGGARFEVLDRRALDSVALGMHLACALRDLEGEEWETKRYSRLLKHEATLAAVRAGHAPAKILAMQRLEWTAFLKTRSQFLLYP